MNCTPAMVCIQIVISTKRTGSSSRIETMAFGMSLTGATEKERQQAEKHWIGYLQQRRQCFRDVGPRACICADIFSHQKGIRFVRQDRSMSEVPEQNQEDPPRTQQDKTARKARMCCESLGRIVRFAAENLCRMYTGAAQTSDFEHSLPQFYKLGSASILVQIRSQFGFNVQCLQLPHRRRRQGR
jgi:hypothetical protein